MPHRRFMPLALPLLAFALAMSPRVHGDPVAAETRVAPSTKAAVYATKPKPSSANPSAATQAVVGTQRDTAHSGAETSMIELQSNVAKRGTAAQTTTGMMKSTGESSKTVAGNIGGGGGPGKDAGCKNCVRGEKGK